MHIILFEALINRHLPLTDFAFKNLINPRFNDNRTAGTLLINQLRDIIL